MVYVWIGTKDAAVKLEDGLGVRLVREGNNVLEYWDSVSASWSKNPGVPTVPLLATPEPSGEITWRRHIDSWPNFDPKLSVDFISPALGVVHSNAMPVGRVVHIIKPTAVWFDQ